MTKSTPEERQLITERLAVVRDQLRATGVTVLAPTAQWTALHKEMLVLARKLK
jgi:hypothetical protein